MFYLLSLLLYARARLAVDARARWVLFAGCAVSAMLALGSKEIAATIPIFILLYEWYFYQDLSTKWIKRNYRAVLVAAGTFGVIGMVFLGANPLRPILNGYSVRDFSLTRISDFAVVPYPPDQSSRPEFAGLRREKPHHGG